MVGGNAEALWLSRRTPPPIDDRDRARGVSRVELSQTSVRVRIQGTRGPTVVIVPDPPNTLEHYDTVVEILSRDARVVVFEVPGFGLSYPRTARFDFSPRTYADFTIEVLQHFGLRGVTLVYSCMGGYVAMMAAREHPELIARLILCQTPAHADMVKWARRFDRLGLLGVPFVGQGIMAVVKNPATRIWYPAALPKGADAKPFLAPALAAQKLGGPYALASGIQALNSLDLRSIEGVEQPTTVIWGHADRTHAKSTPRGIAPLLPQARFVDFEHAGHFPDLEEPRRFARVALDPDQGR
jgi:pimeloyl-ACP methyl ester carboxylesterase